MKLVKVLLAAWTCWMILMVEPQQCIGSHRLTNGLEIAQNNPNINVFKIKFTTAKATRKTYMFFIKDLYNALTDRADRSRDIPMLPVPLSSTNPQQYLHVQLSDGQTPESPNIILVIDISNVYVLGFQAGQTAYFFNDIKPEIYQTVFPDSTQQERLSFTGSYVDLERAAGANRRNIQLGIEVLGRHIRNLYYVKPGQNSVIARALLVMIQMVSEAVRFRYIEQRVLATIHEDQGTYDEFFPDDLMMAYENNWGRLSAAVQSAVDGIFSSEVQLVDQTYQIVRQVLFVLSLMPALCRRNLEARFAPQQNYYYYSIISLPHHQHDFFSSSLEIRGRNNDMCEEVLDPKVHITGLDGLCVSVYKGDYHDGNKIVLSECKQYEESQLWTLRSWDQTVRSNGKCLTAYGYEHGQYVMIYDCDTAAAAATKWQVLSNQGMIKNPKSGLYLTAEKDAATGMLNLTVDSNNFTPRQVWLPTNNTKPTTTYIVGNQSLCLTQNGVDKVWMILCQRNNDDLKWTLYPDGTIRPEDHQDRCLQYDFDQEFQDYITLAKCRGWSGERWAFQVDGTILHVATGLVMDVIETPSLYRITVNNYNEESITQIWFLVPNLPH